MSFNARRKFFLSIKNMNYDKLNKEVEPPKELLNDK